MQDRDSFYYREIRTKIGDALRAQYDVKEPLPEPLTKILLELDRRAFRLLRPIATKISDAAASYAKKKRSGAVCR
jgi:hypothetical protein